MLELNHTTNCANIKEQGESATGIEAPAPGKFQPEFPCNSNGSCCYTELSYEQSASLDGENRINKAFDILFQEVVRIKSSKTKHEISSDIRPGFHRPARRGTND
jgi:hypothetical protein